MGMLIEYLGGISAGVALGWLVAIIAAIVAVYKAAEVYRKLRNHWDSVNEVSRKTQKDLIDFESRTKEALINLRNHDEEVDKILLKIQQAIESMDARQKKKDMNDLKDRIHEKYLRLKRREKLNNGIVFWTKEEHEAFRGLVDSYDEAGGNSFIHEVVMKEVVNWVEVSDADIIELLHEG